MSAPLGSPDRTGRIASFDVFDTLLTRLCGSPRQVFTATGRRLRRDGVLDLDPEAYAAAREQSIDVLTSDISRHPPLAAIVDELVARLALPAQLAALLLDAELAVESEVCRAVPGSPQRLERARRATGRGVVLISDTPLPAPFLEGLLTREGLFRHGDLLVTSSGAGASKQHGGLFDVVAAQLGASASAFDHVGDDRWADVAHPRLRGWHAKQDTRAHLHPRELRMDEAAATTDGIGGRLAGAARSGRLDAVEAGVDPGTVSIATAVAMPLLVAFGTWVLQQAKLRGLERLYFLARDGEVFLEVTRRLAEHAGQAVECRYLYGSRRSWQLASAGSRTPDGELWIPDQLAGEDLTLRALLALVGLTPEDAAGAGDLVTVDPDRVLGATGWARLRHLLTDGPLADEVARRAAERRVLLLRYLAQEGVTAGDRVGFVDIGWTGRAARSLEDVLADVGMAEPAAHLFLGLRASAPERMGAELFGRSVGWLLDEARGRGLPPEAGADLAEDPVRLFETFAMGSEGHTVGFAAAADRVVPVLAATGNPNARGWDFAGYRRALLGAVEAGLDGPGVDPRVDLRPLVWRQVLDFWRSPGRREALAWGAQPYGDDYANASGHPIASRLTTKRLLTRLGLGDPAWREPTYWVAGSIAVSGQPWRSLLPVVERLQRSAGRYSRIPARLRSEWVLRRPPAD